MWRRSLFRPDAGEASEQAGGQQQQQLGRWIPESNAEYRRKEYWDARFKHEDAYEWIKPYPQLRPHLTPLLRHTDEILMLGCGNSELSACMYDDGYRSICNIDFSRVVIRRMDARHAHVRPLMRWRVGDVLALADTVATAQYDVAIDKGTLEALRTDSTAAVAADIDRMLRCVAAALRPGGLYLLMTFTGAYVLRPLLLQSYLPWDLLAIVPLAGPEPGAFAYSMFVLRKHGGPSCTAQSSDPVLQHLAGFAS